MNEKWCYKCGQTYPGTDEYFYYTDGTHKRFKTMCKKCANMESKLSHRLHRNDKKQLQKK